MTQFTKGPWVIHELYNVEHGVERVESFVVTNDECEIVGSEGIVGIGDEARANAHLIAAAPDLYEALKGASELINRILKGDDWGAIEEYYIEAMDALAKARGEA